MTQIIDEFDPQPLPPSLTLSHTDTDIDSASVPVAPPLGAKPFRDFVVNDCLDILDAARKWYEGTVRDVNDRQVLVHYRQWQDQWDEWIDRDSDRLAPLHTHTSHTVATDTHTGTDSTNDTDIDTDLSSMFPSTSSPTHSSTHTSASSSSYYSYNSNETGTPHPSGAVGMRNLGNTCFMNSILQSMAHCPPLTQYFLSKKYLAELNRNNPLGWNGRIAEEFGALINDYWSNHFTVIAPRSFKQALGEFQPRFSGYQQHDSSELLSFLLDGLHEDLNRIIQKPVTAAIDSNGRSDNEVAAESWKLYRLRNESVIVDTMMGQLKSKLVCPQPECNKVSITFDPYQLLSLPLPTSNDTVQLIRVVYDNASNKPVTLIQLTLSKLSPLSEIRAKVSTITGIPVHRLVLADVWRNKFDRIFIDEETTAADFKSHDIIYAYELTALDSTALSEALIVPVVLQQVPNTDTSSSTDSGTFYYNSLSKSATLFGLPRLLVLSKQSIVTGKQIAREVEKLMSGWIHPKPATGSSESMDADTSSGSESSDETQLTPEDGETESNSSYVLVKDPHTDTLMIVGETDADEGSIIEGTLNHAHSEFDADADTDTSNDSGSDSRMEGQPTTATLSRSDANHNGDYRIVLLDSDARQCYRHDYTTHSTCQGCELSLDDEALTFLSQPLSSPPVLSFHSHRLSNDSNCRVALALEFDSESYARYQLDRETSLVTDSSVTVSNANPSSMFEPLSPSIELRDCLLSFIKEETLSANDSWYCSQCKEFRCATKKMDLYSVPNILIIHLKRFAYTRYSREKISTRVRFPMLGLDLTEFLPTTTTDSGCVSQPVYDLVAVSNHMGSLGGGHYTAYVKNLGTGQWFLHDDSRVSAVNEDDIQSSAAYVLFYQRRTIQSSLMLPQTNGTHPPVDADASTSSPSISETKMASGTVDDFTVSVSRKHASGDRLPSESSVMADAVSAMHEDHFM